jgi:hypothetical protein
VPAAVLSDRKEADEQLKIEIVFNRRGGKMKQGTPELSRRQLLAAVAISSLSGIAKGAVANEPKLATQLGSDRKSRHIQFDAQVSRDGQQSVTVPFELIFRIWALPTP